MWRSRSWLRRRAIGLSALAACVLPVTRAAAQPKDGPKEAPEGGPPRSSTQFTLRRDEAGGAEAQAARGRARSGDCAGALASFDAALRSTEDPSLRRDRGLCHDKLGHPFPAIDDYRAYLTARPDAPDTEQIRERLAALEAQTSTGGPPPSEEARGGSDRAEASASISMGTGASAPAAASSRLHASASASGSKEGASTRSYEEAARHEELSDAAEASPLRYGAGVVLGPFLHLPRFFVGDGAASGELAYGVGGTLRYSTGRTVSIVSELGYAGVGTSGEASSVSGPLLMGGVELRFSISRYAGDHLLLRGGAGYERYVVAGSRAATNDLLGRFALGYRHVFGPALGLELLADGGPALVMPERGDDRVNGVIGLSIALLVGL